ncbi:MAG: cysteine dioxygenase family protein [Candidatus Binatia bacterium]|nr:cysteine dioxygenase family protein [Candidatus Binatia bacterium]
MDDVLAGVVDRCRAAVTGADPQGEIAVILLEAAKNPAVASAIVAREGLFTLEDLAIHRSDDLTVLAASIPPGFSAAPHNHNIWSVVSVCQGQEDNRFFERDGDGLKVAGEVSVVAPGVLQNAAEAIHSIGNPLETPLLALHVYGGDLFATPRSNWDPDTHKEIPFAWEKVSSASGS